MHGITRSPAEIRKGTRPCIAYEANDYGYYSAEDADALFAKLEARIAELEASQVTRTEVA